MLVGPAYEVCDDDYDGIGSYDLSTLDETLDGQTGVSISYYESQEDADNATNVLDVNYQNTVPDNQTLYKTRSRRNRVLRYYYTRSNRSSFTRNHNSHST